MSDKGLITKSNQLIQNSVDDLNRREQYLLSVVLAEFKRLNPSSDVADLNTNTVTLTLTEFSNIINFNMHSKIANDYKLAIIHFQSRAFFTWIGDKYATRYPMFDKIDLPKYWYDETIEREEREYQINFTLSKPFIENLVCNSHFTELFRESILCLKAESSIKLYQLLKSYAGRTYDITLDITDLRFKLGLTGKAYDRFDNFWARGIKKPIDEINSNTELHIEVKKNKSKKDKRIVESLTFKISNAMGKKVWFPYEFPDVKFDYNEYNEIKDWITPIHFKAVLRDLQDKLTEGVDIRNHYKWIVGHHNELVKKWEARHPEETQQQREDREFRERLAALAEQKATENMNWLG